MRNTQGQVIFSGSPQVTVKRKVICGRKNQRGLTLVELIVAFTIMLILTTMAVPLARSKVRAMRERDLRNDLREMRARHRQVQGLCRPRLSRPAETRHE